MKKRFTKTQLIQHPLIQDALRELKISPRRIKLSYVPGNPSYKRGISYLVEGYTIIRVNSCNDFEELLWVTLHEMRHLWQFRKHKFFKCLDNQETLVIKALRKANSASLAEVMNEFHDALPTEVDANTYATIKLGHDYSTYALSQEAG